jgi:hypothetical protein
MFCIIKLFNNIDNIIKENANKEKIKILIKNMIIKDNILYIQINIFEYSETINIFDFEIDILSNNLLEKLKENIKNKGYLLNENYFSFYIDDNY